MDGVNIKLCGIVLFGGLGYVGGGVLMWGL